MRFNLRSKGASVNILKWGVIILSTCPLLFFFQNCSPRGFSAITSSSFNENNQSNILSSEKLQISEPVANFPTQSQVSLKGTCSTGIPVMVFGDVSTAVSVDCRDGKFSINVILAGSDGLKNIQISQQDFLGNSKVDARSFVKDTQSPVVSLLSIPNASVYSATLKISGICENNLSVTVKIGTLTQVTNCTEGAFNLNFNMTSLSDGNYQLEVYQIDSVGLKGQQTRTITKDTLAPVVEIVSPDQNAIVTSPLNLSGICENGFNVELSGSGLSSALTIPCTNSTFSTVVNLVPGVGLRAIIASQIDSAGNVAQNSKSYQSQAPAVTPLAVTITGPASNSVAKNGVTLQGSCVNGLPVAISGSGVTSSINTTCNNGLFSSAITFSSGDGSKFVQVTQSNGTMSGQDMRSFIKDSTPPSLTISMPAANAPAKTGVTLYGGCESGLPISISGTGVAAASSAVCNSGAYSAQITFSSGDGAKAVQLTQSDQATNTTNISRMFIRDTVAPQVTITQPAANSIADTGLTITGSCESNINVDVSGTGVKANVSAPCSSSVYSVNIVFSDSDGTKTVQISQTDLAGNMGSVSRSFVKSTQLPVVDGSLLYAQNCAGCHGTLASTTKRDRTSAQISLAISTTQPAMFSLSFLTTAQVQAIADVLKSSATNLACDAPTGRVPIRRLTKTEYANTVRDLFGISTQVVDSFPPESFGASGFDNDAISLVFSPMVSGELIAAAERVADAVFATSTTQSKFINCQPSAQLTAANCAKSILQTQLPKIFRHPPTAEEVNDLMNVYTLNEVDGFTSSMKIVLQAILVSPQFLVKSLNEAAPASGSYKIESYEMASQLSYFLWSSTPDQILLDEAKAGRLSTQTQIEAQVQRMLKDTKAQDFISQFSSQWLGLTQMDSVVRNNQVYPMWNAQLGNNMKNETILFMRSFLNEQKNISEMLTANYSYVNSTLANHYGISGISGVNFQKVTFPPLSKRSGLLTQGSFLTLTSTANRSNPIRRGKWVAMDALCTQIAAPPKNVGTLPTEVTTEQDIRTQLAAHRSNSACVSCHSIMDPLGLSFEKYDAIGLYRDTYSNGDQIDSSGQLPSGQSFDDVLQMVQDSQVLRNFNQCVSQKLMAYGLNKMLNQNDRCIASSLIQDNNQTLTDLIIKVIRSAPFNSRLEGP